MMTQDWVPLEFLSPLFTQQKKQRPARSDTGYLVGRCVNGRGPLYPPSFSPSVALFCLPPLFRVLWPWILGENSLYVKLVFTFPRLQLWGEKMEGEEKTSAEEKGGPLEKNATLTWSLPRKKLRTCGALQGGLPLFSVCEAIVICKIAEASKSTRTKAGSRPSRHIQTQGFPGIFVLPPFPGISQ